MTTEHAIFDQPGPFVLADHERHLGNEPTLRELVRHYYESNSCGAKSAKFATDYIYQWMKDFKEEEGNE